MRTPKLLRRLVLLVGALALIGGAIAIAVSPERQAKPRRVVAVAAPVTTAVTLVPPVPTTGPPPPESIPLARGWQLLLDPTNRGLSAGFARGDAGSGWRAAKVPGVFDARPLPPLFTGTVGWYRLRFTTPRTPDGFGWAVHFDQSRRVTRVWLNGHPIGSWNDPYTPFQLPLPALRPGATNVLVVRVDNRKTSLPREGWWNWGGLTRPVSLVPLGPVTTSDLGLLPQVSCSAPDVCRAKLLIDATLTDRSGAATTPTLALLLTPPPGGAPQIVNLAVPELAPGASAHLRVTVPVAGPLQLWAPGHPRLYHATVQTLVGSSVAQLDRMRIGMRQAAVRGGVLYLNGAAIQVRGASIEEDIPGRGPALRPADAVAIVHELQAMHANMTRSQYPLSPLLLDRLDRAGILLWTEAPIYHADEILLSNAQRDTALATLRGSVLQTRNHPSVIAESVANELSPIPDSVPTTRSYINDAVPIVRQLDPGTPVALDVLSYPGYPSQQTFLQFDLLGIDNYFGWYPGHRGIHSTANIDDLAPYLRLAHARYPRQALVMTEFGAEASLAGPADVKQTYAFQTSYFERTLAIAASLPFVNGALYWTVREFAVKPYWDGGPHRLFVPRDSIHHKGLISYDGAPKPAFAVAARLFAQTPLYRKPPVLATPAGSGRPSGPGGTVVLAGVLALLALAGAVVGARRRRRSAEWPSVTRVDQAS